MLQKKRNGGRIGGSGAAQEDLRQKWKEQAAQPHHGHCGTRFEREGCGRTMVWTELDPERRGAIWEWGA